MVDVAHLSPATVLRGDAIVLEPLCVAHAQELAPLLGYVQATGVADGGVLTAHLAWVVGVPHQGTGVATAAATLMASWLGEQTVERLVADVYPEHVASRAVARALGMTRTDEVVDGEVRWARILG